MPSDVFVIDNACGHVALDELEALGEVLAENGVQLVRLPTYSPNLNHIELIWSTIKARLPVPRSQECARQRHSCRASPRS